MRDRRTWVRFAIDLNVTYRQAGALKDSGWPGRVANVSAGGLSLLLRHRFEAGTQLAVEVHNRAGTFRRTLLARVVPTSAVIPVPGQNGVIILSGTVAHAEDVDIILRTAATVALAVANGALSQLSYSPTLKCGRTSIF